MKKKLIIKQDGYKECGVACLLSIIRYYGGNISINKLIEYTHTDKTGTNFYNLKKAAEKFGLETEAFRIENKSINSLKKLNTPSICQIIENNYEHFIVIYEINNKKIIAMDPAKGKRIINISNFMNIWTGYCMCFIKTKPIPFIEEKKYINKIIIELLNKNKSIVLNIIILSILFTITSSIYVMYSGIIIDHILMTTKNYLFNVTIIFFVLLLIKNFLSFFRNKLLIYLNQKLDCSIFLETFYKILLLPYSYYKNRTTGEMITRINDLEHIKNLLSKIILTLFLDVIISSISAIILIKINIKMFLLVLITILVYIILLIITKPIIKKYTNINQENNAKINSLMYETISGFETIKNLGIEENINKKMTLLYIDSLKKLYSYDNICNIEMLVKDFISYLNILIVEYIGFNYVFDNVLTTGQIIVFTSLITIFVNPIREIIDINKEYYYAINSLKRANNLLDVKSVDIKSKTNYVINGNIKFNKVNFTYNSYKNTLKNINFTIKRGDRVLLLGKSGSGKSTILKLLSKYYKIERNKILIDNIDINDISNYNLKKYLTVVSQNEILFTDTIKNNIIANRNINNIDYNKICKLTYVDEIINNMYLGDNTKIEENGYNLSGGQKQRIILARALLKIGNIILIDEGLNAMDIHLERKILKNIFSTYKQKTFIIVSHRIENIDLYNKVLELKNGAIKIEK